MRIENPRKDLASKKSFPKKDLFRLVVLDGVLAIDKLGSQKGRGHYLHKDLASIKLAKEKGLLNRIRGCQIPQSIYEEMEALL